jgi:hypothetical protein
MLKTQNTPTWFMMGLPVERIASFPKPNGRLKLWFRNEMWFRFVVPDINSNPLFILNTTSPGPSWYEMQYRKSWK